MTEERYSAMRILLVEDNPDDVEMLRRIVNSGDAPPHLDVASSAEQSLVRLRSASRLPAVIFLDISLPGLSGLELLRYLKGDPVMAEIPVIMLSGADNDDDVRIGCAMGAHSHFVKPINAQDLGWVITAIRRYWERVALLPQI